jgi:hypothetical protein
VARRDKASALCRYAVIVAGNILSWTSPPPVLFVPRVPEVTSKRWRMPGSMRRASTGWNPIKARKRAQVCRTFVDGKSSAVEPPGETARQKNHAFQTLI